MGLRKGKYFANISVLQIPVLSRDDAYLRHTGVTQMARVKGYRVVREKGEGSAAWERLFF